MQAMPAIPADTQAPPARTDQAAPAPGSGATFRNHLAAATGKQQGKQPKTDDNRQPAAGSHAATAGQESRQRPRVGGRGHGGRKKHSPREAAAGKTAEQAAEQVSGPTPPAGGQEGPSLAAIVATLSGGKTGKGLTPQARAADNGSAAPQQADRLPAGVAALLQKNGAAAPAGPDTPGKAGAGLPLADAKATDATPAPAGETKTGTGTGKVVVEHWSATFSGRMAAAADGKKNGNAPPASGNGSTIGKTLVSVQRIPENEEMLPPPPAGAKGPQVNTGGQRQDINSSYIHANLPNQASPKSPAGNGNGQQPGGDRKQNGHEQLQAGDQVRQQQRTSPAPGDQPLVFSLDQAGGVNAGTAHQAAAPAAPLHQAPGLPVSEAHVMDQVIHRFTGHRQLESGTVVLRLHPQELGELRMEIKVEQDNIKAHITTNNPQVQDILDRHLPRLRDALEQQGMNLEQMQVTVAPGDNGNTQLFQEHRGRQQARRPLRAIGSSQPVFTIPDEERKPVLHADDRSLSILA